MRVRTWLEKYDNGDFKEPTRDTLINACWFDWFSSPKDCLIKMEPFYTLLNSVLNPRILDKDIEFKECMPIEGPTYVYAYLTEGTTHLTIEYRNEKWYLYEDYEETTICNSPRGFKSLEDIRKFLTDFKMPENKYAFFYAVSERNNKIKELVASKYDPLSKELFSKVKENTLSYSDYIDKMCALMDQKEEEIKNILL